MEPDAGDSWQVQEDLAVRRSSRLRNRWLPWRFFSPEFCVLAALALVGFGVNALTRMGGTGGSSESDLAIHTCRIEGLALSCDGRTAASASRDGTVRVWDLATRRELGVVIRGVGGFSCVAFGPDGRTLAAGGLDGRLVVWDVESNQELAMLARSGPAVRALAFSPDGTTLAAAGDACSIHVWDLPSCRERAILRSHTESVNGLAFAPDGTMLVSAGFDGQAIVWDVRSCKPRERYDGELGPLRSVTFAPDGRSIAWGGARGIAIRELSSGRTRRWSDRGGPVTALLYLSGGTRLASTSLDGPILIRDIVDGAVIARFNNGSQWSRVKDFKTTFQQDTLIAGNDNAVVRFYDLSQLQTPRRN